MILAEARRTQRARRQVPGSSDFSFIVSAPLQSFSGYTRTTLSVQWCPIKQKLTTCHAFPRRSLRALREPAFPIPGYYPRPGLYALDVDDGSELWSAPVERGCTTNMFDYFSRDNLYPDCPFYYGLSAAPVVVNDVVFAPSLDGKIRAFAVTDGEQVWNYDTLRAFETINGVEAHGGSIDVAGVQAAGRMIYVQSGYSIFGQLPGNVLLAFRLCEGC